MYEPKMIQHKEYLEIKYIPYDEEKQKEIRKKLKKSLVVLKPDTLKPKLEEMYEESNILKDIFECYSNVLVKDAKRIRNTILHSDSIQKNYSFGLNDPFAGTTICGRDRDFYEDMVDKIDGNIRLLRNAILLFREMVIEDKIPNRKENAGKIYIVFDFKCKKCGKTCTVPDLLEEYIEKYGICEECGEKQFIDKKKFQVSELYYGTLLSKFLSEPVDDE